MVECVLETEGRIKLGSSFSIKETLCWEIKNMEKKLQFRKIDKNFYKILLHFNRQALHAKSLGFYIQKGQDCKF